ncbi:peroxisomal assembly protein [Apophysomyces ossiformis]|uniref:Peroxisomal ATPase PEX6 n=1 Tax=Apophysomyces ossiformis TaxID=679940 RepID=A0A8H7BHN5_9FUNG|nr:peroxisomal assembly protein [Apophysomyces ossiformis]
MPLDQNDAKSKTIVYANAELLKDIYGPDALTRLDEEDKEEGEQEEEEDYEDLGEESRLCLVKAVQLIELDEVILGASNPASYEFTSQDESALAPLFSSQIVRSAGRYRFDHLAFQVMMTSPVLQGYITERTKIMAVDLSSATEANANETNAQTTVAEIPNFSMLNIQNMPHTAEPQEFDAQVLPRPWPTSRLFPAPNKDDDDESRVFVHVKDLARCGVFSGDWVLVSASDPKKSRLCRVYAIVDNDSEDAKKSIVYIPPVLYYNLGSNPTGKVFLTHLTVPSPDGPPLAGAVSIARIASPSSMDKHLQAPFLEALKQWFEDKQRIVCEGDVIAVCLDEESTRLRPSEDEPTNTTMGRPTTVAYFKVSSLEEDEEQEKGKEKEDQTGVMHPGYYGRGRRISPSRTKMIQTGVEHLLVPGGSISQYYNFANKLPLKRTRSKAFEDIYELVSSSLHPLGLDVELSCNALLHGPRGGGKATLVREVAEVIGVHLFEFMAYDIVSETDAKTEVYLRAKFEKAAALSPCIVLLRGIEGLAKKSAVVETGQEPLLATVLQECIHDVNAAHKTSGYPVMVIATTSDIDSLPSSILGCFRHEVAIEAPDEKARYQILENLTYECPIAPDVSLKSLATQTAALVSKDLVDLVGRTGVLALQRIRKVIETNQQQHVSTDDLREAGIALTAADFDAALNEARASYSDSIGAPKIPNVTWDDVGGLANVKDDILDTIQLPLEHPELFGSGLKKRSGILLYGPPGTGKTLLAKAIATSCSLNFFSVKGPELLNMYIGESEANVRRVFQRARDAKPCVIFFDELDSVAPKRGEKGDSGGVMDRIVSQLLAELDGMSEGGEGSGVGDVFVIGATNRPDLLDPALLRPGRFDKLLYLGVSQDHESQLRIIQALTRKFRLHPDLDLARVAERCPFHYTGADFYALCSDAMLKAMTRVANSIEDRVQVMNKENPEKPITAQYFLSHLATPEDIVVQVEEIDFIKALDELVPSVSATELAHYTKVREKFEQNNDDGKQEEQEEGLKPKKDKGKGKQRA